MSKETLRFIETLYEKEKAEKPKLDHDSFIEGARAIIEHFIDRL